MQSNGQITRQVGCLSHRQFKQVIVGKETPIFDDIIIMIMVVITIMELHINITVKQHSSWILVVERNIYMFWYDFSNEIL